MIKKWIAKAIKRIMLSKALRNRQHDLLKKGIGVY